jgi:hypothetical protein
LNSLKAKRLLLPYRPGVDNNSQQMAEALFKAATDADLRSWFTHQQRFHEEVRRVRRRMAVPPELKGRILSKRQMILC